MMSPMLAREAPSNKLKKVRGPPLDNHRFLQLQTFNLVNKGTAMTLMIVKIVVPWFKTYGENVKQECFNKYQFHLYQCAKCKASKRNRNLNQTNTWLKVLVLVELWYRIFRTIKAH